MVSIPLEIPYEKAAGRMPGREDECLCLSFHGKNKETRHIPRSNSRIRRPKFSLLDKPQNDLYLPSSEVSSRSLTLGDDGIPTSIYVAPLGHNINNTNSSRSSLSGVVRTRSRNQLARRRSFRRSNSREYHPGTPRTINKDSGKLYRNEADFLIQNQHNFSQADFEAVLAAMAEESRIDQKRQQEKLQQQEDESILLARKLAIEESKQQRLYQEEEKSIRLAHDLAVEKSNQSGSPNPHHMSSSNDNANVLKALAVALRAELDETDSKLRDEEESYRLACHLVTEEAKECGMLLEDNTNNQDNDMLIVGSLARGNSSHCQGGESQSRCANVHSLHSQCLVCHFDIDKEETLRELPCGHHFHAFCINRWFVVGRSDCPTCRRKV